jgi:CheY-like chemotaxis protein
MPELHPVATVNAVPAGLRPAPRPPARTGALAGLTLLAVEDSRLAADGLRLLCRSQGARLRRASNFAEAERHLSLYRPDAILIDLGLPDRNGEGLVATLARAAGRPQVIIAMSGDPSRAAAALACGADGFLPKPVMRIEELVQAVLPHLPHHALPLRPVTLPLTLDPLALADDLAVVADLLEDDPDPDLRGYLSGFLAGIARQCGDSVLLGAAEDFANGAETGLLLRLVADRRAALPPF